MGFKASTKEAPAASRNRKQDPAMVKLANDLVSGKTKAILATGDENATGKNREKSARADASKVAHYIRTKHENVKVRTVWVADEQAVYVALVTNDENGNGAS